MLILLFFPKFLLILSWDLNLNPGLVHGIHKENLLRVLSFHDYKFSGDDLDYNLDSFSENVSKNDWKVFLKKRIALYSHKDK